MAAELPPPLYRGESALLTYGKALGTLAPVVLFWIFAKSFLVPKLQWLWEETNMAGTSGDWLLSGSIFLMTGMQLIAAIVALLLLILEFTVKNWQRYRAAAVGTFTVLVHTIVLLALTWISVSVLLAAPLLTRKDKAPPTNEVSDQVESDELPAEEAGTPQ